MYETLFFKYMYNFLYGDISMTGLLPEGIKIIFAEIFTFYFILFYGFK